MNGAIRAIIQTIKRPGYHILSLIISLLYGGSLYYYGSGVIMNITGILMMYSLITFIFIPLLDNLSLKFDLFGAKNGKSRLLPYTLILFIIWLPFLIIKYPGGVQPDTWEMIFRYYQGIMDDKQSVFYSLMINLFVFTGERTASADAGLFAFLTLQHLLNCFCFAYAFSFLDLLGTRPAVRYAILILTILNPYIIGYVGTAIKDVPFSSILLLITVMLAEHHLDPERFHKSPLRITVLILSVLLLCFLRNNGIYIVLITCLFLVFLIRKNRPNLKLFIWLLSGVLLFLMTNAIVFKACNVYVQPTGYREALSIPFQQTARYVRDHSDDITPEEYGIIDENLMMDTLASRYDPRISDPVKNGYEGDKSGLAGYFKVWGQEFLRHPMTYVDATWEQNRSLLLPSESAENYAFTKDYTTGYEGNICYVGGGTVIPGLFTSPEGLLDAKETVIRICIGMLSAPVIACVWNVACSTIALIIIAGMSLIKKIRDAYYLCPLLSVLLITIAGPVIMGHPRYMFPVIFAMPFIIVYFLYLNSRSDKQDACQC